MHELIHFLKSPKGLLTILVFVAAIIAVFSVVVFATGAVPRAADDLLFDHISFGVADPARAAALG